MMNPRNPEASTPNSVQTRPWKSFRTHVGVIATVKSHLNSPQVTKKVFQVDLQLSFKMYKACRNGAGEDFYYSRGVSLDSTFEPIDGGVDRVCRGRNVNDNHPSNYLVVKATDLDHCERECRASYGCLAA